MQSLLAIVDDHPFSWCVDRQDDVVVYRVGDRKERLRFADGSTFPVTVMLGYTPVPIADEQQFRELLKSCLK